MSNKLNSCDKSLIPCHEELIEAHSTSNSCFFTAKVKRQFAHDIAKVRSMNRLFTMLLIVIVLTASFLIKTVPVRAAADSWIRETPMPFATALSGAVAVNGKIYALGAAPATAHTLAAQIIIT